jgi:hypothetical protein
MTKFHYPTVWLLLTAAQASHVKQAMSPRQALLTPHLGLLVRNSNSLDRSYSSLPDAPNSESGSLGGFVSNFAHQLGVGEYDTYTKRMAAIHLHGRFTNPLMLGLRPEVYN